MWIINQIFKCLGILLISFQNFKKYFNDGYKGAIFEYANALWAFFEIDGKRIERNVFICIFNKFSQIVYLFNRQTHFDMSTCQICLNCYVFPKLSRSVSLINVQILILRYAKGDCRLWKALWFNCFFLGALKHLFHQTFIDCVTN